MIRLLGSDAKMEITKLQKEFKCFGIKACQSDKVNTGLPSVAVFYQLLVSPLEK